MGQNRTPTAKAPKYVLSNFSFIVFGASSDRKLLSRLYTNRYLRHPLVYLCAPLTMCYQRGSYWEMNQLNYYSAIISFLLVSLLLYLRFSSKLITFYVVKFILEDSLNHTDVSPLIRRQYYLRFVMLCFILYSLNFSHVLLFYVRSYNSFYKHMNPQNYYFKRKN